MSEVMRMVRIGDQARVFVGGEELRLATGRQSLEPTADADGAYGILLRYARSSEALREATEQLKERIMNRPEEAVVALEVFAVRHPELLREVLGAIELPLSLSAHVLGLVEWINRPAVDSDWRFTQFANIPADAVFDTLGADWRFTQFANIPADAVFDTLGVTIRGFATPAPAQRGRPIMHDLCADLYTEFNAMRAALVARARVEAPRVDTTTDELRAEIGGGPAGNPVRFDSEGGYRNVDE